MWNRGIGENPSTISSLVLLLGLISRFPTNELRVATNAQKRLRIDYNSVTMSKNALGIWYESPTIFRNGEFVAKVLNSSKLLSEFLIDLGIATTHYRLCESVKIFTNSFFRCIFLGALMVNRFTDTICLGPKLQCLL